MTIVTLAASVLLLSEVLCESFKSNASLPCTLEDNVTCYQYTGFKVDKLVCNVSDKGQVCEQLCNSGNCSLSCNASKCKQNCLAGRCGNMECNSPNCYQRCVRGNCKMQCNGKNCQQRCDTGVCDITCPAGSEICIQICNKGMCKMQCPIGVKICKQHCSYGNCIMLCNAKQCKRTCRDSMCSYSSDNKITAMQVIDSCNYGAKNEFCYQDCISGNCLITNSKLINTDYKEISQVCNGENCNLICKDKMKCGQICIGGNCKRITCNAEDCFQECISGACEMECTSTKRCLQVCRGGYCSMTCPSAQTSSCEQVCAGGSCKIRCDAMNCNPPKCIEGSCNYIRNRPPESGLVRDCLGQQREACRQVCTSIEGCNMFCNPGVFHPTCKQTCDDGYCNQKCTAREGCYQNCAGSKCELMDCNSEFCVQACNGGQCGRMVCSSRQCTQLCVGFGCEMICTKDVLTCSQSCNTGIGRCKYTCLAKKCTLTMQ